MKILLVAGGPPSEWPSIDWTEMDYFVGIDRGSWYILQQGCTLNLAVGDFDSLTAEEIYCIKKQADECVQVEAEKDDTDTQLALHLTLTKFPQAKVTLIGATSGRLDHFLANLWLPLEERFQSYAPQICLRDKKNSIHYLLPGDHVIQQIPQMKYLAYCCLTPITNLQLMGSKYTLKTTDVTRPISYASNEFINDKAYCSFDQGIIAVIQSCD